MTTKPVTTYNIYYVLNGGTNSSANPSTYDDDKGVASFADPTARVTISPDGTTTPTLQELPSPA